MMITRQAGRKRLIFRLIFAAVFLAASVAVFYQYCFLFSQDLSTTSRKLDSLQLILVVSAFLDHYDMNLWLLFAFSDKCVVMEKIKVLCHGYSVVLAMSLTIAIVFSWSGNCSHVDPTVLQTYPSYYSVLF